MYKAPHFDIAISREDPGKLQAGAMLTFVSRDLKPIGPVGKSLQLAGGTDYRKALQKTLRDTGHVKLGQVRCVPGGKTEVVWVFNFP